MNLLRNLRLAFAGLALIPAASAADWPQWRGPQRNGVLTDSRPLANSWPADGPRQLWESELIPSDDDGGHGSVVIAGQQAFISVVWHRDVPTETRAIDDLVLRKLGHWALPFSKALMAKMEGDRESLSPQLRGAKLDEWAENWVKANLDKKQQGIYGGHITGRFKKGPAAIPYWVYDRLVTIKKERFPNDAAMQKWLDEQKFPDAVRAEIVQAVPPSYKAAEDVIVCLDVATGKTVWKTKAPGEPTGRNSSSTPCVAGGRVYALGSTHVYCVDAATGKQVWAEKLPSKAPGSSPLVVDGALIALAGTLTAWDAATGKELWQQKKVGGNNSSPALWRTAEGRPILICNGRNEIVGVDLKTGDVLWTTPGGGDSTPAVSGDNLVVYSRQSTLGLTAYRLTPAGAEPRWSNPVDAFRTQSSPLIQGGHVYLMDDGQHQCLELATGKVAWQKKVPSNISSPVLADGKILVLMNGGNNLLLLKATPEDHTELAKANVRAQSCPSPALADGRLLLRLKDRIRCYDVAAARSPGETP